MPDTMMLIALDQSTQKTGCAIFQNGQLVSSTTYDPKGKNYIERICMLRAWLKQGIENCPGMPDKKPYVAIEDIQLQDNLSGYPDDFTVKTSRDMGITTFKKLAQVQGVILELLTSMGIDHEVVPAATWKKSCGVRGRSRSEQKAAAMSYIKSHYSGEFTQDECDAICIGLHVLNKQPPVEEHDWS